MMNSKERTLAALDNRQPDKVPIFEDISNASVVVRLAEFLSSEPLDVKVTKEWLGEETLEIVDLYCFVINELQLDATFSEFLIGFQIIDEKRGKDKYGTFYRLSQYGIPYPVEGPIKNPSDVRGFNMTSKLQQEDSSMVQHVIEKTGSDMAHFVEVSDPFKISWHLRGTMEILLMDYILYPQLVHDLARISTDFDLAVIDMIAKTGADAIMMGGDLASEITTVMSPEHYRQYIKPYHKEIVCHAHREGLRIVKHSDGNIWPILDDLVEVGFDGIDPIQPQCMDIEEVKEYLGGRTCIMGNIDCRNLLPFGTEEEVKQSVKETIKKAAPHGGYIICSSNSIHPGCKSENYIAMVEAAHKYGKYV